MQLKATSIGLLTGALSVTPLFSALGMWKLLPTTLLLDGDAPTPPAIHENRHLGYAFQWFALKVTMVIVTVVVTLRGHKAGTA